MATKKKKGGTKIAHVCTCNGTVPNPGEILKRLTNAQVPDTLSVFDQACKRVGKSNPRFTTADVLESIAASTIGDDAKATIESTVKHYGRCGNNVNAQLEAVPEDGAEHEIHCDQCGQAIKVRRTPPD